MLTQLCGGLHQAPGLAPPLPNDQVQQVGLQAVLKNLPQGWTQVLEDQVAHVRTHPAVPQLCLGMIKYNLLFSERKWKKLALLSQIGNVVMWSCRACGPTLSSSDAMTAGSYEHALLCHTCSMNNRTTSHRARPPCIPLAQCGSLR